MKKWLMGCGGLIVLIIVIAGIAGAAGGSKTSNSSSSNSSSTPSPSPSPSASPMTSAQAQLATVTSWYRTNGTAFQADDKAVTNDLTQVSTDAGNSDDTGLVTACQQLSTDAQTMQALPAIPDSAIASHISSSLSYLNSAGQDCVSGVNNQDSAMIDQATQEMSQGTTQMEDATNEINSVEGS